MRKVTIFQHPVLLLPAPQPVSRGGGTPPHAPPTPTEPAHADTDEEVLVLRGREDVEIAEGGVNRGVGEVEAEHLGGVGEEAEALLRREAGVLRYRVPVAEREIGLVSFSLLSSDSSAIVRAGLMHLPFNCTADERMTFTSNSFILIGLSRVGDTIESRKKGVSTIVVKAGLVTFPLSDFLG